MRTINEMIKQYSDCGITPDQARLNVCQEIVLKKISNSKMANNILLKGGVVMFNMSKNERRSTKDLDFDFIKYDISEPSIEKFIQLLDKTEPKYFVKKISITELNQDNYDGKRAFVYIGDKTNKIKFKLDIGVHTLFAMMHASVLILTVMF